MKCVVCNCIREEHEALAKRLEEAQRAARDHGSELAVRVAQIADLQHQLAELRELVPESPKWMDEVPPPEEPDIKF